MTYSKSIYIFHRSLRLNDNIGLIEALKTSDKVVPIFIFTPEQITKKNKFRSKNAIIFMIEALIDLNSELKKYGSKLFIFYGEQDDILDKILKSEDDIEAVYINEEYTKYGVNREKRIIKTCEKYNRELFSCEDYLLHPINNVLTGSGTYYSKFTPFYNKIIKNNVDKPIDNRRTNYISAKFKLKGEIGIDKIRKLYDGNNENSVVDFKATRVEGKKRLNNIKNHKKYANDRNNLEKETTRLSPYIKFGLVSIREVYHKILDLFGKKHDLIKQLYWREFYYNLSFNRQDVFSGKSFKKSYDKITWKNNQSKFNKWKNGETGFPIVDAGMRELKETGFMHNRSRLITSNFLVKLLGIDWRKGELHYSSLLVDYDPSVNNGNWQWTSGSGADSQPYFRIFNPWTQGKKFDPDCTYIKKWIPELDEVPAKDIHEWGKSYKLYEDMVNYPAPCISYDTERKNIKKLYKKIYE